MFDKCYGKSREKEQQQENVASLNVDLSRWLLLVGEKVLACLVPLG